MSTIDDRPPPPPPPPGMGGGPAHAPGAPAGRGGPGMPTPAGPPGGRPAVAPPRRLGRRTPVSSSPGGLPTRRRWGRFAAGVTLALLGAWVFAAIYVSAGERVEVIAVARDVPMYQQLEEDDLRRVRVAADPSVETIGADKMDDILDRLAAVPLKEGTLLSGNQLFAEDVNPPGPGQEIITGLVSDGQAGPSVLVPGRQIRVHVTPENQDEAPPPVDAEFYTVGSRDENSGKRQVEFIVNSRDAGAVSVAASEGRISLSLPGQAQG